MAKYISASSGQIGMKSGSKCCSRRDLTNGPTNDVCRRELTNRRQIIVLQNSPFSIFNGSKEPVLELQIEFRDQRWKALDETNRVNVKMIEINAASLPAVAS